MYSGKEVTGYTYGTDVPLPTKNEITRKGYTFEGWYTDNSFSGSPVTKISSNDGGNKTFYAKWKQNIVPVIPAQTEHNDANHNTGDTNESSGAAPIIYPTLTFDTCGGSSIKVVRAFEGHTINLAGYRPTRGGYEFSSWYADQNLTQPITEIRLDGNRTVYAGWIKQAGEDYKPGSAGTQEDIGDQIAEDQVMEDQSTEDQVTEDQVMEDQSTENTGDEQELTIDNSPMDNSSKPDDSVDLLSEKTSDNNMGILIACAFAGAALIGVIIYIIYKKGSKGRRL